MTKLLQEPDGKSHPQNPTYVTSSTNVPFACNEGSPCSPVLSLGEEKISS